jgi:uncharacterized protein (TIGR02271 family)
MTTERSPYSGRPIVDWFDESYRLVDVDGDTVGDIVEVNPEFVIVQTDGGFLGLGERQTYYIPRTYIAQEEGRDWALSIDKDEIGSATFTSPPADSRYADWQQTDRSEGGVEAQGRTRMVRFEEDLEAGTTTRQAGEVSVRKHVTESTETLEVPVRREEVHVERRPVTDAAVATDEAGATAFQGTEQEIRVPVMQEEVEVRKVARPVEEVVVTKDSREEMRTVSDTVRKEQFDVDDTTEIDADVDAPVR